MNDKKELIWIDEVVQSAIDKIKLDPKYQDKITLFENEYFKLKHKIFLDTNGFKSTKILHSNSTYQ